MSPAPPPACLRQVFVTDGRGRGAPAPGPLQGPESGRGRGPRQDAVKVIRLADDLAVDGALGGDETAYINHSCEPNAYMRIVPGEKVAFFALRDISPGEEVSIDYRDPDHPAVCHCGASRCRSKRRA